MLTLPVALAVVNRIKEQLDISKKKKKTALQDTFFDCGAIFACRQTPSRESKEILNDNRGSFVL